MAFYKNRIDAGRQLAGSLRQYAHRSDVLVLGLPRGGVPVAFEVAMKLDVPMDIFLVRKLGVPGQEELAFGAIASGGVKVINEALLRNLGITPQEVDLVERKEMDELERREEAFRGDRPEPQIAGKTVILVDDGLATGASMYAAVLALRELKPQKIVVAVPVAAPQTCSSFEQIVDQIVCLATPTPFYGVGQWYEDFSQVSDDEVSQLLYASEELNQT